MTISEENIVKRWKFMASKDLGYEVNPLAAEYARFFEMIFVDENTQFGGYGLQNIKPFLRGFSVNHSGEFEKCSVTECYDLDLITFDKEAAQELDYELMNNYGWFSKYQYARSI